MNTSDINPILVAAVYLALILFSIIFNALTAWAEKKGYMSGYTSLFVVGGVLATLIGLSMISLTFALISTGAFIASGTWMIVGSIWRHVQKREHELEKLREEARHGNTGQEVANKL